MKKILFSLLLLSSSLYAQTGKILGKVLDTKNNIPLNFASIKISQTVDNKLITGNITDQEGKFSVDARFGKYYAEIEFMGYQKFKTAEFELTANNSPLNLGEIKLQESSQNLEEVVVQAEKSSMELTLDKRVFNVGKDLANAGGSAAQILVNIPSVSVEPDGVVKLRGSSNVRILIDGKPSGLMSFKGGAGLQQLQASMIERVEVITNPSARYEAEGMAGIINIILKKDKKQGFNGSFGIITGYPTNYGISANINYRHKKINFFINYGLSYITTPYRGNVYQEVYANNATSILKQTNQGNVTGFDNNIRGGLDYFFTEKSILTASYMLSRSDGRRLTENVYNDYLNAINNPLRKVVRNQDEKEIEPLSEYVLSYKRSFERKGHELNAQFRFLDHWENSDQLFTQAGTLNNGKVDKESTYIQNSINDEFEKHYLGQIDYVQPFAKDGKFELGARASLRNMVNDYIVNTKADDGTWIPVSLYNNYFTYKENISAIYGIVGNKIKHFSYQAGLRTEWTDVTTKLRKTNEVNPRKYANLFPSVHFTYQISKDNSLQLSYSKRIRRPVYNDLSPFMTVSDSRNFNSGNPDLNPEYSDVYEFGHLKNFEKGSLNSAIYFRNTKDVIASIRNVNEQGLATTFPENLNGEKSYGIEFTGNYALYKWWKLDANFNLFHSNIDGSNIDQRYVAKTNSWFIRQTSRFNLPKGLEMQLRANYDARQKTAQGIRKGIYFFDFSLSKTVLEKRGTINLAILDMFNSRWMRTISEGTLFYTENNRQFRKRQINLTFNYRIKS